MAEMLSPFFQIVLSISFVLQMMSIALAGVIVLGRMEYRGTNLKWNIFLTAVHTVFLTLVILVFEGIFFCVFNVGYLRYLRGLNFSLPVLVGYILYACFMCDFQKKEKVTLTIILFSTAIVMMEWSAPYGVIWLAEGRFLNNTTAELLSDIMIVFFACFIRRFSVTKYQFTDTDAWINCTESALVAIAAVMHEMMSADWGLDVNYTMKVYISVTFIMLYAINLLTYVFSYQMARSRQMLTKARMMEQKQAAELEMAELTAESLQELREIRHDIKNQYLYMRHLLEKKRYDDLND